MLILQYKVSFTYDRLGSCFRFGYIYASIAVLLFPTVSRRIKIYIIRKSDKRSADYRCIHMLKYSPLARGFIKRILGLYLYTNTNLYAG